LETSEFELRALLDDLAAPLALRARQQGIAFRWTIAPDVPAVLRGDPGRLRQDLTNLANNAVKFTAQGEVSLAASLVARSGDELMLRFVVRDTGIGIPPELLHKLFQKFTQADASTTRRFGGTGLGLVISKTLVEMMGGQIGVTSQPGEGSEFWCTVRLGQPAGQPAGQPSLAGERDPKSAPPAVRPPAALPALRQTGARVLVAEDNAVNQQVALGILRKLGLHADAVGNGAEAVEVLKTEPYDLVLMDIQMPEMDGLQATQRIRDPRSGVRNPQLPIIAMTAAAMPGDRQRCLQAGMNDYITKPVVPGALIEVLNQWLPEGAS
jgi:CheY-like chemotaxis protein